jgi:predicted deacylase
MRIGEVDIEPGRTARGTIPLAGVEIPIRVARGVHEGPTLWVNAAIHGDELEGTAGLWQVFDVIADMDLKGALIGVLITNVSAYTALRRSSPIDDLDINRVFPGDPNRSFTLQLAYAYRRAVESTATHYIDLHGGGNTHDVVHYTIYRDGANDASEAARRMAEVAGAPIVWSSRDKWLENGLFALLTDHGIPALIVEAGGEGRIRSKNVTAHSQSVLNVMKHLGMIDGSVGPLQITAPVKSADFFFSHHGGIWLSDHTVGDRLAKGDLIGLLRDPYGDAVEEIRSESTDSILLALRTYAGAPPGSNLGILGVIEN